MSDLKVKLLILSKSCAYVLSHLLSLRRYEQGNHLSDLPDYVYTLKMVEF